MDLNALLKATYSVIRDSPRELVSQDDMIDALNDAYVDLAVRLEVLKRETAGTTSGGTVPIPDGTGEPPACIRIFALRLADGPVDFTNDATWFSHFDGDSSPRRTLARVDEDEM